MIAGTAGHGRPAEGSGGRDSRLSPTRRKRAATREPEGQGARRMVFLVTSFSKEVTLPYLTERQ